MGRKFASAVQHLPYQRRPVFWRMQNPIFSFDFYIDPANNARHAA